MVVRQHVRVEYRKYLAQRALDTLPASRDKRDKIQVWLLMLGSWLNNVIEYLKRRICGLLAPFLVVSLSPKVNHFKCRSYIGYSCACSGSALSPRDRHHRVEFQHTQDTPYSYMHISSCLGRRIFLARRPSMRQDDCRLYNVFFFSPYILSPRSMLPLDQPGHHLLDLLVGKVCGSKKKINLTSALKTALLRPNRSRWRTC